MSGSNGERPDPDTNLDDAGSAVGGERRRGLTTLQKVGVAGLVLAVFLVFIWIEAFNKATTNKQQQAEVAAPTSIGQTLQTAPPVSASPAPALPLPAPAPPPSLLGLGQPSHEETAVNSPILAFSGGMGMATPAAATQGASTPSGPPAAAPQAAPTPTPLTARLKPTVVLPTKAELLPHPDFLITEGTLIPCTLQTAIDSELAGYVKCVLPQDIRGTTGNVVLLDKGTEVTGEIQSGLVQGQSRVFVLWDRAETPQHAVITLDSPGSDELGRAGLPGAVNNHFWARFGSAIMLSVIQGGLQAGTALAANSGNNGNANSLFLNSFSNNGSELSNTALQASINIPPTLEKNQGDNVSIFVNKDLDFSDVYSLRVTGYGQ